MNNVDYGKTVRYLLESRGKRQVELAEYLFTSRQNLSDRMRKNSFTNQMLDKICDFFDLDVRAVAKQFHQYGYSFENIIDSKVEEPKSEYSNKISIELSPEEVRQILFNQTKTIDDLQKEIKNLSEQFKELIKCHEAHT
jgi:transcriptional regulator with XRE-family HTH domain